LLALLFDDDKKVKKSKEKKMGVEGWMNYGTTGLKDTQRM
jgi:hypothetical protein